jgi:hypothetical protein
VSYPLATCSHPLCLYEWALQIFIATYNHSWHFTKWHLPNDSVDEMTRHQVNFQTFWKTWKLNWGKTFLAKIGTDKALFGKQINKDYEILKGLKINGQDIKVVDRIKLNSWKSPKRVFVEVLRSVGRKNTKSEQLLWG